MRGKKKNWKKELLPAINACFIAGLFIYSYTPDKTWLFWFIALFFIFAKNLLERIIDFFVYKISPLSHWIIFSILAVAYLYIYTPMLKSKILILKSKLK